MNRDKDTCTKESDKQQDKELSHTMAHYLVTIHKLKEIRGFARITDIARELHLTKGSVSTAINGLKKKNLVKDDGDCKFLVLTEFGHKEVHKVLSSRELLFYFLKDVLGVDCETASIDACEMEHLLSNQTREKFFYFMKNLANNRLKEFELPEENQKIILSLCEHNDIEEFISSQKAKA